MVENPEEVAYTRLCSFCGEEIKEEATTTLPGAPGALFRGGKNTGNPGDLRPREERIFPDGCCEKCRGKLRGARRKK